MSIRSQLQEAFYGHVGVEGHRGGSAPRGGSGGREGKAAIGGKRFTARQFVKRAKIGAGKSLVKRAESDIHANLTKFISKGHRTHSDFLHVPKKLRSKAYVRYYDTMKASGHTPKPFLHWHGMISSQYNKRATSRTGGMLWVSRFKA